MATDHQDAPVSLETIAAIRERLQDVKEAFQSGTLNVFDEAHHAQWSDVELLLAAIDQAEPASVERFMEVIRDQRGIVFPCDDCGGLGTKVYPTTSTWRSGIGGSTLTMGPCNTCWGSGDEQAWPSHAAVDAERQRAEQEKLRADAHQQDSELLDAIGVCGDVPIREAIAALHQRAEQAERAFRGMSADLMQRTEQRDALTRELAALREAQAWRPIETADPDKPVELFTPRERLTDLPVHIAPDIKAEIRVSAPRYWTWATHWRPLPAPPPAREREGQS